MSPFYKAAAFLAGLLCTTSVLCAADAIAELGKFSAFEGLDISKLSGGKVLTQRGPTLDSPRDLGIQAVYLVPAPVEKVVELHRRWDPSRYPGQKVVLHADTPAKPVEASFAKLQSVPASAPAKSLATATQKLPGTSGLQLSAAEAGAFTKGEGGGAWPPPVGAFWSHVLLQRAQAYSTKGLGGQPALDAAGGSVRAADEAARLLKEQPKLRAQFRPLVEATPLGGGTGTLSAQMYWELFEAESGQGALSLGAAYTKEGGETAQILDLQYYASGGYYVYFTLYQLWSISVEGKPATLVWRGDSVASQELSELRGVERMGSGAAMMKEIQKSIGFFQKEAAR